MSRSGGAGGVLRDATAQFEDLTGRRPEGVSAMRKTEDGGWVLCVEVVELRRVPDTVSLLATYELHMDSEGALAGWERVRRYERGRADQRG